MLSGVDSSVTTGRGEFRLNATVRRLGFLLGLGSDPRNALSCRLDAVRGHPGAGDLLDLASGTGSIVDLDALTEPQIDDVLLASHLLRGGGVHQREQGQRANQQDREKLGA